MFGFSSRSGSESANVPPLAASRSRNIACSSSSFTARPSSLIAETELPSQVMLNPSFVSIVSPKAAIAIQVSATVTRSFRIMS
jgi:hypothetical protein